MHYTREELGELGAFALTVAVGLGIGLAASSVWIGIAAGVVTCVLAFGLLKADEKHGDGTITTILVIVGFTAMLIHLVRSVAHLL